MNDSQDAGSPHSTLSPKKVRSFGQKKMLDFQDLGQLPWVLIGAGRWGTALSQVLKRTNSSLKIETLDIGSSEDDWQTAFSKEVLVLIACPFSAIEKNLLRLKGKSVLGIVNASKGIDHQTLGTFSQVCARVLPGISSASLSGPTFAEEVAKAKPTACVIASEEMEFARALIQIFSNQNFRAYSSEDIRGVEVCGAVKNVLAIAAGLSDGLKLGSNARAALLTRGLREMNLLVHFFGGKTETVFGLAGVGDLWLTAAGDLSRNRRLGLLLAEGKSLEESLKALPGPAEGHYTVKQVHRIAQENSLELPISESIYRLLFENLNPQQAIVELMTRDLKSEDSMNLPTH